MAHQENQDVAHEDGCCFSNTFCTNSEKFFKRFFSYPDDPPSSSALRSPCIKRGKKTQNQSIFKRLYYMNKTHARHRKYLTGKAIIRHPNLSTRKIKGWIIKYSNCTRFPLHIRSLDKKKTYTDGTALPKNRRGRKLTPPGKNFLEKGGKRRSTIVAQSFPPSLYGTIVCILSVSGTGILVHFKRGQAMPS